MDRAVFVALSGAIVQERRLQVLSENLANMNMPGFKKKQLIFEDSMAKAGGPRVFAIARQAVTDMSQGFTKRTERRLDVALKGEGFFKIETPSGTRYTRNGTFSTDKKGTLVTSEGYSVLGHKGVIKLTGTDVLIDADGNISDKGAKVDKLAVVNFEDPSLLMREGNFFLVPGPWVKESTGKNTGKNEVLQGYLEAANVNPVKAVTDMIEASRSYETHAKMIQTIDDMTRRSIDEIGKTS